MTGRGLAGTQLFQVEADGEKYLGRLARLAKDGLVRVYAWTLMPTHFHLLLRTGAQPLPTSMRQPLTGFAVTFNQRHKRR